MLQRAQQMLKGKLDVVPEILAYTVMVALGTFVVRRALKTDAAAAIARIPFLGVTVTGTQAVMDEAYAG